MPDGKAENRAVGEQLVEVGVRVAGGFLGLVLGVDDRGRAAIGLPDDVRPRRHLTGVVQVVANLTSTRPPKRAVIASRSATATNCSKIDGMSSRNPFTTTLPVWCSTEVASSTSAASRSAEW